MAEQEQQVKQREITQGDLRTRRQMQLDDAMAQRLVATRGGSNPGAGSTGLGALGGPLSLAAGDPSMLASLFGIQGLGNTSSAFKPNSNYNMRSIASGLNQKNQQATTAANLQNQMLLEQLNGMSQQNAMSRQRSKGAGLGGTGGMMGGRQVAIDRMSPYDYEQARGERAKDTRLEQELMREQMMFEQNLRSQEEEASQQRKLQMFMQLLQRMRGGDTSTSSTNETGVSYQNVAGRPVAMPTQSSSVTRQQTPTDKLSLLRSILSGF